LTGEELVAIYLFSQMQGFYQQRYIYDHTRSALAGMVPRAYRDTKTSNGV